MEPLEIEEILYNYANRIVGEVGNSGDSIYAETGEEFIEVVFEFDNNLVPSAEWEEWFENYVKVAKNIFRYKISDIGKPLKIYWRTTPHIEEDPETGKKIIYARFLISNAESNISLMKEAEERGEDIKTFLKERIEGDKK
jgi:hypothetical protein